MRVRPLRLLLFKKSSTRQTTTRNDTEITAAPFLQVPVVSYEVGGACDASAHGFVFPAAAVAGHAAAVARPQGGVAAHARRQQRQTHQRRPAQAEALVAGVAGARVGVVALGVGHAVVEQAVGAPHEANAPDAGLDGVGRLLAATSPVVLVVEHVLTVNAARSLAVLLPPLPFGLQSARLHRHHRPAPAAQLQTARLTVADPLHVAAERVRVRVVVFGRRLALGEVNVSVQAVGLVEFVPGGDVVAVIPVAGEQGSLARVDANDLLLLQLETDVARKHVHGLEKGRRGLTHLLSLQGLMGNALA